MAFWRRAPMVPSDPSKKDELTFEEALEELLKLKERLDDEVFHQYASPNQRMKERYGD